MTENDAVKAARSRLVKHIDWEAPNGELFEARVPTSLQMIVFFAAADAEDVAAMWHSIERFLKATFSPDDADRIFELIEEGEIDLPDIMGSDDEGDGKSLLAQLSEEVSGGRPTQSSDDSSGSSARGGKRSTGRSPGKGSTRSTSRQTAS